MMFWSCFLHAVILTWSSINVSLLAASSNNEQDRLALLAIKDQIREDPLGALSSWNHSLHYCQWEGVTCASRHRDRVRILDLKWQKLEGTLSPHIGNLSFLRVIWLHTNNFHGHIPQEIGRLSRLRVLSLANNSFSGEIPVVLTSLSKLTGIHLYHNQFQGTIPSSLGNLSSLTFLDLGINNLRGSIPEDLCRIRRLTIFQVALNSLTGMVPSCLYNLSNIEIFSIGVNHLHGTLPQDIGLTLPNLIGLLITHNNFTGFIPSSLSNASRLENLHLSFNSFTGNVPRDLGNRLKNFKRFTFADNLLGTDSGKDLDFISSLTNCTLLQVLNFGSNSLKAPIPNSIANLSSQIICISLGLNLIYGSVPAGLGNLFNLQVLGIGHNHFTGKIPKSLVMLPNFYLLDLSYNKLSGKIPDSFSNSSLLERLDLSKNQLSGSIPMSLGGCENLFEVSLSQNNLSGTIPKEVIGRSSIKHFFNLSHNALSGPLPLEVTNLTDLQILDISNNRLSGAIPSKISNCLNLEYLSIEDNFFTGSIPPSLGVLKGLKKLIVSHNGLTGEVPKDLQNLTSLTLLDLSYNNLEGSVPTDGVFANASAFSIVGNSKLCGGIVQLELLPCHLTKKKKKSLPLKIVLPVISASVCLILLSCFLFLCYRRKVSKAKPSSQSLFGELARISYAELRRATNSFAHDNLIGVGSYGSVYKGVLDHVNTIIAVKVFNLQERGAAKSFLCECNALRNLRHRNLLKIITSCSSIDFQGNDFKALVFKYMPNGSLEDWLHSKVGALQQELRSLNFLQRLNIAIDVASALDYLHNHCQPAVVHCDLKPSNVLVDGDMTAHVADFGLAKIFSGSSYNSSQTETGSLAIKGSIGYVAPEYGLGGQVSMEGDVFSYGILLLEMFTGKRPTDDMFQNGKNLHSFARTALPDQVMNILDPRMLLEGIEEIVNNVNQSNLSMRVQECLVSSMTLGVECSAESPSKRMNIGMIVRKLYHIRNHYQDGGGNQLVGTLPQDIGLTLPKLRGLLVTDCNFTGFIPSSLSNASRLETLHLGENHFTGNVPSDLGYRLQNFKRFTVRENLLGTDSGEDLDFISSLTNCTLLQLLDIGVNSLKAPIPNSRANLSSQIIHIYLDSNLIYGSVPVGLGNLFNLQVLVIRDNHLTGKIPKSLVMLPNLDVLDFSNNKLSGKIPDSFSNSSLLERLDLSKNQLSGSIPMSLGDCKELFELSLSHNNLSGTIPKQVIGRSSIKYYFNLSHNALSGLLPLEVANLTDLQILDIANNRLSSEIPWKLSNCLTLEYLSIEHNFFTGSIPPSLGVLRGLKKLIVSHNGLTGEVPKDLQNLTSLTLLDLSYNNLEGPVPTDGVFANATAVSIVGNNKLCGGIVQLELLPCHLTKKKEKSLPLKIVLPVISASVCLILLSCFLFLCYRRKVSKAKPSSQSLFGEIARISYAELRRATNSFAHDNLIGVGSYGSVYKGVLDHVNTIIAVKVFNLQEGGAAKSFLCECNALRNLRHRNLLKIITSCSSIDFQGNDFKALVFKYMPNGSLEDWLHSKVGALQQELRSLNFLQRLNIAIDVASVLDYLHNHCQPAVVHCDLKPSNVLVDGDMTAHVADFGLAKIFSGSSYNSSQTETGSLAIKGSIGYVAPEYGLGGQVSMKGDVYSYGILLLEMFIGKRPTDDMFHDGKNLHSFARTALPDQVMNIMDPRMLLEGIEEIVNNVNQSNLSMRVQECLVSSMTLGVECSVESPSERMNIGMIVRKLYHIRNHYQGIHPL